jgi:hypothetical protein
MKVKDLYEELKEKKFFQEFSRQNPEAFLYAGFFILDLKESCEKIQLDFYNPKTNKIEIIEFPFQEIKKQENKLPGMEEPEIDIKKTKPLNLEIKIDIDDLEDKCKEVIKENNATMTPSKIIAVLRNDEWHLTCMDDMLGIITIQLDSKNGNIKNFKKNSLMDMVKIKKTNSSGQ